MSLSTISATSEATLEVVLAPSSIPPAPESGVVVCGTAPTQASPAPTAAVPCAEVWPGASAAETLRPSQVLTVAADELDWLYEHTDDETDPICIQARAAIEGWLADLSPEHRLAITLHHDPTPWPEELPGHEEDSFGLVLHLLWPSGPRDSCCTPRKLELRARRRLEIRLEREGSRSLKALVRRARWLFEEAVRAYAEVRGRLPSVVPEASSGFSSSLSSSDFEATL